MSLSTLGEIHYLPVCFAALASYVLGGLWYTVLFGEAWSRAYGFKEGEAIKQWKRPGTILIALFAGDLTASFVIALFIVALGMASPLQGGLVGFLLWLGAVGSYGLGAQMASARSMRGYFIDAGRLLASMLLMGVIHGVMHG